MRSIRQIEDVHIRNLSVKDELGQFDYLLDLGVAMGRDAEIEICENRIRGCKTAIWVKTEGRRLKASSDSLVVLGLLSILMEMYEGMTAQEVRANPIRFLDAVSEQVVYPEIRENGISKLYGMLSGTVEEEK